LLGGPLDTLTETAIRRVTAYLSCGPLQSTQAQRCRPDRALHWTV